MSTPKYTFFPQIRGDWAENPFSALCRHQMSLAVFILTPGPMVEAATQLRIY